jgi:hypothetical protein
VRSCNYTRTWFGRACSMRWGSGNACEVQARKAVGVHLLKKSSRCRSDGDINPYPANVENRVS